MAQDVRRVAVVGTGVIGASWIALFLAHGLEVMAADPGEGAEQRLYDYLDYIWPQLAQAPTAIETSPTVDRSRLRFLGAEISAPDLATVDLVQENCPEQLDLKIGIIASLAAATRSDVPICSSTSGLVPSTFVGKCGINAGRVLVAHPWNPPHLIPLVEIVPHSGTSRDTVERAVSFYIRMGKKPIVLQREAPGFVGNRLQAAVAREAFNLVASGVCEPEDVEAAMVDGLGPRWALTGPFMTSTLGGGGNPGGFERFSTRLGPAFASWEDDMDKTSVQISNDRTAYTAKVFDLVDRRIGKVDTQHLQIERNNVLKGLLDLRKSMPLLDSYASGSRNNGA